MNNADKPRRTWLRFTVRAMLLLAAVVGLLPARQDNSARRQRALVNAVQRSGGWVHYDYEYKNGKLTPGQGPWTAIWLGRLLGHEYFGSVRQVNLVYHFSSGKRLHNENNQPCDDLLEQIASLPALKELLLEGNPGHRGGAQANWENEGPGKPLHLERLLGD